VSEPEEYQGGGLMAVFLGLLILFWIGRAIFSGADQTK
jgi:hypothetical protein